MAGRIAVLGIFAADLVFKAKRLPRMGETVMGEGFSLGPGGKGSNQAVAAAKAGGAVDLLTAIGQDSFAEVARRTWSEAGVESHPLVRTDAATGAAFIFLDAQSGENGIIVAPGAAGSIGPDDIRDWTQVIANAGIFLTQLETPLDATIAGLKAARSAGVRTILNPAPAADLTDDVLGLCDILTPNETEAEALTGLSVGDVDDARRAAGALRDRGVGAALITLGANGAVYDDGTNSFHVPGTDVVRVVDTTGAGDAFNGALAVALSEGRPIRAAVAFANAAAAISVTRQGAAKASPSRNEIDAAPSV